MSANKTLLICRCAGRRLLKQAALEPLLRHDGAVAVDDLCRAAAAKDPALGQIAGADEPVVCACHPRAVRALFAFAGFPLPQYTEFINLRIPAGGPSAQTDTVWYPVIDEERCTNCGQCFEFCLFGVYEKDSGGQVRVTDPFSCKNNCPACARICPSAAIIFPKAGEAPINGAEITDEEALKANIKNNVDEILGGDVYAALNARRQKRRSLLDQKKVEQALAERKKCSEGNA